MATKAELEEIRAHMRAHPDEAEQILKGIVTDGADAIQGQAQVAGLIRLLIAKGVITYDEYDTSRNAAIPVIARVVTALFVSDEATNKRTDEMLTWLRTGKTDG